MGPSSIGVVEDKEKLQVIHDLMFSKSGADERKAMETREQEATQETEGRSVNEDADKEKAPKCLLTGVMTETIK